jgi:NADPH:quinone reductase-like Zn-dependent oxidoreductase
VFSTPQSPGIGSGVRVTLEGVSIDCRIVETPDPVFDGDALANRTRVLVRKTAFSLNYRDRAYILGTALNAPPNTFAVLGSEFAGEVVACGGEVEGFRPGMRVMANNSYPAEQTGIPGGLPGNNLSRELEIIPAAKLARIPDNMSDVDAAAFSIGAQTTFSMVRKLAITAGSVVLVTGGRSNTSLFAINAVKAQHLDPAPAIWVSTTSNRSEQALMEMGVTGVIRIDPASPSFGEHSGFDAVIDPFYSTCGRYNQTGHLAPLTRPFEPPSTKGLVSRILFLNLQIIGNCLGLTSDLEASLAAYAAGRFPVVIDKVFRDGDAAGFLDRTYNSPERFGKVVYAYN